jgi:hypothetical protein
MQDALGRLQAQQEATAKREASVRDLQAQLQHGHRPMPLQLEPSLALASAATTAPARVVSGSPALFHPHSALQKAATQVQDRDSSLDTVQQQGIFNWARDDGNSTLEPPTAVRSPIVIPAASSAQQGV